MSNVITKPALRLYAQRFPTFSTFNPENVIREFVADHLGTEVKQRDAVTLTYKDTKNRHQRPIRIPAWVSGAISPSPHTFWALASRLDTWKTKQQGQQ